MNYNRYYQHWHLDTDEHYEMMKNSYKILLRDYIADLPKNARILEIGSGMGFCMLALESLGFTNVVGVDLDTEQTQKAKGKGLNVHNMSVEKYFQEQNEQFDLILMFDVLEHLEKKNVIPILEEIHKYLNRSATLIIQTPNCYSIAGSAYRYIDFTHELSFSSYSLDFVLYNAGFENILIKEITSIQEFSIKQSLRYPRQALGAFKKRFARKLYRFLLSQEVGDLTNVPLSANIIAIAKKS